MSDTQPVDPVLKTTIEFSIDGIEYEFRIPGVRDSMALSYKARQVRRAADPEGVGDMTGIDNDTFFLAEGIAALELLLSRCSDTWPFSKDAAGNPVVDSSKFPPERVTTLIDIGMRFRTEVIRFRSGGNPGQRTAGTESVAG